MPKSRAQIRCVLTIAGSDSGGAAGLQADLKTFLSHDVHGTVAVTCVTAQNTIGVHGIQRVDTALVRRQIVAVLDDLAPEATKTGFLAGEAAAAVIEDLLDRLPPLVVDPVCVDKHGRPIVDERMLQWYRGVLLPRAALITPNVAEAALITGIPIRDRDAMLASGEALLEMGAPAALVKGGRLGGDRSPDLLCTRAGLREWLDAPRVETTAVLGTGDTLAAAIAARLAWGADLVGAVRLAKRYVSACLQQAMEIGQGQGPVGHVPAEPMAHSTAERPS